MIELPQVTLVTVSGIGYKTQEHLEALKKSQEGIKFGAVKYIQDGSITDLDSYSRFMIYELPKYIDTDFVLTVQADGWVVNPELWNDDWLNYDFCGAPWPLPTDPYSYRDENGWIVRVGNGAVSLRSKKLLNLIKIRKWRSYYGNSNEDGFITCHNRQWLETMGCKFLPLEKAVHFAKEIEIPENVGLKTFGFHKYLKQ